MKKQPLAFIDVETTGFDPNRHEIIDIGGVIAKRHQTDDDQFGLTVVDEFEFKVKPTDITAADPQALAVNGYNEAEWMFAPDLSQVMPEVAAKTAGAVLVAHNLWFDLAFLEAAFAKTKVTNKMHHGKLDTISMAFIKLCFNPAIDRFSLAALAEYFDIDNPKAHTALADAKTTMAVFEKLLLTDS